MNLKELSCIFTLVCLTGCGVSEMKVHIESPCSGKISAIDGREIINRLGTTELTVKDKQGKLVSSQVTHDSLLLILPGKDCGTDYFVSAGKSTSDTLTCGRVYPERQDDLCWENDVVGFRAYGPGTTAKGEKMYGYDLFLKRGTTAPVIESLIKTNNNPEIWIMVDSLRSCGLEDKADSLINTVSYHIDHGYGMDCYAVGPTLGAGATAVAGADGLIFPGCYKSAEILDNGPLRFTARLKFEPIVIDGDSVTEIRKITLDAGCNLNSTEITYQGVSHPITFATGIALHDNSAPWIAPDSLAIAYTDPTQGTGNGALFIGNRFASRPDSISVMDCNGTPHILAFRQYHPGTTYTYYWGYGWDKGNIASFDAWKRLLQACRMLPDATDGKR